jgi:hypothetical protein
MRTDFMDWKSKSEDGKLPPSRLSVFPVPFIVLARPPELQAEAGPRPPKVSEILTQRRQDKAEDAKALRLGLELCVFALNKVQAHWRYSKPRKKARGIFQALEESAALFPSLGKPRSQKEPP